MNFIEFNNLTIGYSGSEKIVLNNINFSVSNSKPIFVVGGSGQGKTSFFLSILQSMDVKNGHIIFNKQNITNLDSKKKKIFTKKIGFLSQFGNSIEFQNVYTNVVKHLPKFKNWFYSLFNIATQNQKQQIYSILKQLGLEEQIFAIYKNLSGGQQQRVEIAKLMLTKPSIILADEPTKGLDQLTSQKIFNLILTLAKQSESIVFIASHNANIIKKYDGYFLVIHNKKAILFNSFDEISPELKETFLI